MQEQQNSLERRSLKSSTRIVMPDLATLPEEALLTDAQTSALSGFSIAALKKWRREGGRQGPKFIFVEGRPRSSVRAYREWISGAAKVPV